MRSRVSCQRRGRGNARGLGSSITLFCGPNYSVAAAEKKINALLDEVEGAEERGRVQADTALRRAADDARAELAAERESHSTTRKVNGTQRER